MEYREVISGEPQQSLTVADPHMFARLVEQSLDGTAVAALDGVIQFVNPAWARMHGYEPEELVGRHLSLFHTEEQIRNEVEPFNAQVETKGAHQAEMGHVRRDGTTFPTWMSVSLLRDEQNNPLALVATAQDLTSRKQLEAERAQLIELLEAAPDVIGMADTKGQMIYMNPAGRRLLSQGDDVTTENMSSYVPHWAVEQLSQEGLPEAVRRGIWTGETSVLSNEGEEIPVSIAIVAHKGASGRVDRFSALIRDISELKQAEAALREHAEEMATVAEVSAAVATIRDMDQLLQKVVDLTRERFGLYHSHIYLLNATRERLLLAAGAGEVGQQMVAEQRSIALQQENSLVARAGRELQGVIVNDVEETPEFLPHPLLPNTRSELAVPLVLGEQLIGVLDVQSDRIGRFTQEDVNIFTTLASQVAVAVTNARLFEQTEEAMAELNVLTRRLTHEGWEEYLQDKPLEKRGYVYDAEQITPLASLPEQSEQRISEADGNGHAIVQPIVVHGASIGRLALSQEGEKGVDEETAEILAAVALQLGARIENLRLTEQTESALVETETLFSVSTSLNLATTLEEIVKAVAQPIASYGADGAGLFLVEGKEEGTPEWAEFVASWQRDGTQSGIPIGTRIHIPEFPLTQPWKDDTTVPLFVENTESDKRADPAFKAIAKQAGAGALIFQPLMRGSQVLGFLSLRWQEPRSFDETERRLYNTTASQAGVMLDRWLLLQETRKRADELEELTQIEARLSQATTEETILASIVPALESENLAAVHLSYVDVNRTGEVEDARQVAAWIEGALHSGSADELAAMLLTEEALERLGLVQEEAVVLVPNVQADARLNDHLKKLAGERGIGSMALIPLHSGGRWQGMLNFLWSGPHSVTAREMFFLRQLTEPVAASIASRRAYVAQQQALSEAESLYNVTADLNVADNPDEILQSASRPAMREGAAGTSLFLINLDEAENPESAEFVASWDLDSPAMPPGDQIYLPDYPLADLWFANIWEPTFIEDVLADERVTPAMRELLLELEMRAVILAPLTRSGKVAGLLSIRWDRPQLFDKTLRRLYRSIVTEASVMLDRWLLLEEIQERAQDLEILAALESDLSQSETEEEMVKSLLPVVEGSVNVGLGYLGSVHESEDLLLDMVAIWADGEMVPVERTANFRGYPVEEYPLTALWYAQPEQWCYIANVHTDERVDETMREHSRQFRWQAALVIPLQVAGRMEGLVWVTWLEPHELTAREQFVLRQMVEPLAAAVARRRAQLAQREALAETRMLYRAGADLNRARSHEDVLNVIRRHTVASQENVSAVTIIIFDEPWTERRPAEWFNVAAYWTPFQVEDEQMRFPAKAFPSAARTLRADAPTFIPDVETSELIDENVRKLYGYHMRSKSVQFVPLWVAGQWIGYVAVAFAQNVTVPPEELQRLVTLVDQAAVAVQNINLLQETHRLFEQSEMRAHELAVLNEMGQALTALTNVTPVVETIHEYTSRLMNSEHFYVALYYPEENQIDFPVAFEEGEQVSYGLRPFGSGVTEYVIRTREPLLIVENAIEKLETLGIAARGNPAESWLGVPMIYGDQVMGVLAVQSPTKASLYNNHDMDVLSAVGSAAAIAIQNARLFQETQERAAETRALYEASRAINTAQSYDAILSAMREQTVLGENLYDISLNYFSKTWHEEMPEWVYVISKWGNVQTVASRYHLPSFPVAGKFLRPDWPSVTNFDSPDVTDENVLALFKEQFGATGAIFIPLVVGGQWIGYILAMYQQTVEFTDEQLRRLMALAGQAATAVQGLYLLQEARQRAHREQVLREVTASVRRVTDVDLIMKTAVREVGRALGREAFVYLGNNQEDGEPDSVGSNGKEKDS